MHMERTITALVAAVFFLSGCKEELWSLKFDENIVANRFILSSDEDNIQSEYLTAIRKVFADNKVDPSKFSLSIDKNDRSIIHVAAELNKQEIRSIEDSFRQTIQARQLMLEANIKAATEETASLSEQAEIVFDINFRISKDVELTYTVTSLDILEAGLSGTDPNTRTIGISCNVVALVDPPEGIASLIFNGTDSEISLSTGTNHFSTNTYEATLAFSDPTIHSLYTNGKMSLSANTASNDIQARAGRSYGKTKKLLLDIGKLQEEAPIEDGSLEYFHKAKLDDECEAMAAALGRPFTFTFGKSLDRLTKVEVYKKQN